MEMLVDAHCHLEHKMFEKDVSEVISRAKENNVICISYGNNMESNKRTLALADGKTVFAACGLDAFNSKQNLEDNLEFLEENKARLAAIGEIGLDQHYFGEKELSKQIEVLEAMLGFAEKNSLAAVIHTRKAEEKVLELLPSYNCTKVLHFFLEKKLAPKATGQGCFLSLPTIKSKDRTTIIKNGQLEFILAETDAPYAWKDEKTGKPARNEPKNVKEVYGEISALLGKPFKEVEAQLYDNAKRVFRI
ncbi:TatD family hydrolase [Candidatus Micrarchaeota archaeon]|nr:TatD family hydrolase [Candidatus Micrarchaeota archaeon]